MGWLGEDILFRVLVDYRLFSTEDIFIYVLFSNVLTSS